MRTEFTYKRRTYVLRFHRSRAENHIGTRYGMLSFRKHNIANDFKRKGILLEDIDKSSCRQIFVMDGMIIKISDPHYWQSVQEWDALNCESLRENCLNEGIYIPEPIHKSDNYSMVVSEFIPDIVCPYEAPNTDETERVEDFLRRRYRWGDSHARNWGYQTTTGRYYVLDLGSFQEEYF